VCGTEKAQEASELAFGVSAAIPAEVPDRLGNAQVQITRETS
jgi:hypothetical protein